MDNPAGKSLPPRTVEVLTALENYTPTVCSVGGEATTPIRRRGRRCGLPLPLPNRIDLGTVTVSRHVLQNALHRSCWRALPGHHHGGCNADCQASPANEPSGPAPAGLFHRQQEGRQEDYAAGRRCGGGSQRVWHQCQECSLLCKPLMSAVCSTQGMDQSKQGVVMCNLQAPGHPTLPLPFVLAKLPLWLVLIV